MFKINEDLSIDITRGDAATFNITVQSNGEDYVFQAGDVVRFKVFERKGCECVVLQKDFSVETSTEEVTITLTETDTKIGGLISKPKDYWYEVELNPNTYPQTIVGYDDNGAKVFKLYPEGKDITAEITPEDIPIVDKELDMTSERPVENQAIARKFAVVEENVNNNATHIEENAKAITNIENTNKEQANSITGIATSIQNHENNNNNPHGVTAEQVGARPNTWLPTIAEIGAAPAGHVKKTFFTIPPSGTASITFNSTTNAMIYCRSWAGGTEAVFNYSGYAAGAARQNITTLVNGGSVACGLNLESAGQGMSIKNYRSEIGLDVCIDSGIQNYEPVITFTEANAAELYVECPNPPMLLGVEYRTTKYHKGKPIYTMALNLSQMPNATTAQVDHGIPNVDEIFLIKGSMTNDNNTVSIPYYESTENVVGISAQRNRVVVTATGNASMFVGVVHLEYTKTTD